MVTLRDEFVQRTVTKYAPSRRALSFSNYTWPQWHDVTEFYHRQSPSKNATKGSQFLIPLVTTVTNRDQILSLTVTVYNPKENVHFSNFENCSDTTWLKLVTNSHGKSLAEFLSRQLYLNTKITWSRKSSVPHHGQTRKIRRWGLLWGKWSRDLPYLTTTLFYPHVFSPPLFLFFF